ncbi:hypothetical protein QR680_000027 [Steinernema hermaphroditum]|uniref:Macro domain-containing protein n=1 Tax=Steinernema hermaphroditum TaxID=289476 RepID=A0AA39GT09_9BILA|nr:hypothetical protein QR680_000027 [Steinernema hermaphroditum]
MLRKIPSTDVESHRADLPTKLLRLKTMAITMAQKIRLVQGDITKLPIVEVIVNAANKSLLGGGGVDGAIHRAAGPELQKECRELNGCKTGEAKLTSAHRIAHLKGIIHTVGPRVLDDNVNDADRKLLERCYVNSLNLAVQNQFQTIAFPCISTGIYGYPQDLACSHVLIAVKNWLSNEQNFNSIKYVVFCVFLESDLKQYLEKLPRYFEGWCLELKREEDSHDGDNQQNLEVALETEEKEASTKMRKF